MSAASLRLKSNEIKKIITQGKFKNTRYLVLYWQKTTDRQFKRAIVISKQVDKRAVVRNRIRRVIGEQIRIYSKDLVDYNLVVKVKKNTLALNSRQLRKEVIKMLSISGLLKISS